MEKGYKVHCTATYIGSQLDDTDGEMWLHGRPNQETADRLPCCQTRSKIRDRKKRKVDAFQRS